MWLVSRIDDYIQMVLDSCVEAFTSISGPKAVVSDLASILSFRTIDSSFKTFWQWQADENLSEVLVLVGLLMVSLVIRHFREMRR